MAVRLRFFNQLFVDSLQMRLGQVTRGSRKIQRSHQVDITRLLQVEAGFVILLLRIQYVDIGTHPHLLAGFGCIQLALGGDQGLFQRGNGSGATAW